MIDTLIQAVEPRPTVEVHLPDGRVYSGPRGSLAEDFMRVLPEWDDPPIVGAVINGELRELTYKITMDSRVNPSLLPIQMALGFTAVPWSSC
jgi:uridine kinase